MKPKIALLTFLILILVFVFYMFSGFSGVLSDEEALKIIYDKAGINISDDSANVVSAEYNTNYREYGFLIVVDIECPDIHEIVRTQKLHPLDSAELTNEEMPAQIRSIINQYYDNDMLLYCRYEHGRLLSGEEHTASLYLIALSEEGRLIVFEDV